MYVSNLFKSTPDMNYSQFPCFKIDLVVSEPGAWNTLRENKVTTPYFVAEKNIYFTDLSLVELDFFDAITKGSPKRTKVSNETITGARIIGNMLYRAIASYLFGLNFRTIGGITAGSVYFIPDDPMYIKEIQGMSDEGSYIVFRGFGPKIHAMSIPRSVFIFLETRSKFRIKITQESWPKWIGYPVKAKKRTEYAFKGSACLDKIDQKRNIGILKRGDSKFEIPLNSMYVPASSDTLGRREVYEVMLEFAQFRDKSDRTIGSSFEFLRNIFKRVLEDDSFTLKMDSEGEILSRFRQVDFKMSGE